MSSQSVNEWRILRDALVSSFASNGSESSDVAAEIALVTRYLEPTLQVPPIIPVSSGHVLPDTWMRSWLRPRRLRLPLPKP